MSLDQAMAFTLAAEGKYTVDDGGPTMYGVTQSVYDDYRSAHKLPAQTVRDISMIEVADIMENEYWEPAYCYEFNTKLGIAVFDWAYNHGVTGAIETLQGVLGVVKDGIVGQQTMKAINLADQATLLQDYLDARRAFYEADTAQSEYLQGWLNRVDNLQTYLRTIQ